MDQHDFDRHVWNSIKLALALGTFFFATICLVIFVRDLTMIPQSPGTPQAERIGESPAHYLYRLRDDKGHVTCYGYGERFQCLPDQK